MRFKHIAVELRRTERATSAWNAWARDLFSMSLIRPSIRLKIHQRNLGLTMHSTVAVRQDFTSALQKISSRPPILMLRGAQWELYRRYRESKPLPTPERIQQKLPNLQLLQPHTYRPSSKKWEVLGKANDKCLERGGILRVVSWNIYMNRFWVEERASAALKHLRNIFGDETKSIVIMFQAVRNESLRTILEDSWVQQNFILSNIGPPKDIFFDIPDESFTLKLLELAVLCRCFQEPMERLWDQKMCNHLERKDREVTQIHPYHTPGTPFF